MPTKHRNTATITFSLPPEMAQELREVVKEEDRTVSELLREVALFRSMKENLQDLSLTHGDVAVWGRIRTRITMPIGWILTTSGVVAWLAYGTWAFVRSPSGIVVKLATGGVAIGILVLLAHVIWDRYKEYGTDPYRNVHR